MEALWESNFDNNYINIEDILKNKNYANTLKMTTNTLCKKIKKTNPELPDHLIQAHVFTVQQILLLQIISLCT